MDLYVPLVSAHQSCCRQNQTKKSLSQSGFASETLTKDDVSRGALLQQTF